jgi:hypothetical protein
MKNEEAAKIAGDAYLEYSRELQRGTLDDEELEAIVDRAALAILMADDPHEAKRLHIADRFRLIGIRHREVELGEVANAKPC